MDFDCVPVGFKSKGHKLSGEMFVPDIPGSHPGVVLCHGLGADRRAVRPAALELVKQGMAVLIFDFSGHGRSGGIYDGDSKPDVIAAFNYLAGSGSVEPARVAIAGHSMGAGAAIQAAAVIRGVSALAVLSCPPDKSELRPEDPSWEVYEALAKQGVVEYPRHGPLPWVRGPATIPSWLWMKVRGYRLSIDWSQMDEMGGKGELSQALAHVEPIPILFVHCRNDMISPYDSMAKMYEMTRPPKQLIIHETGFHAAPLMRGKLRKQWVAWLASALMQKNGPRVHACS
ncbi:MAG: alpha/beta fold hydrolase [Chloroflexi bacterium]|nr:alpha/beta fold hydrolase [Chloroflexota bacterium]